MAKAKTAAKKIVLPTLTEIAEEYFEASSLQKQYKEIADQKKEELCRQIKVEQIKQSIRDQLPKRWAADLSDEIVSEMGVELAFLSVRRAVDARGIVTNSEYSPTERGIKFGVRRLVPREG